MRHAPGQDPARALRAEPGLPARGRAGRDLPQGSPPLAAGHENHAAHSHRVRRLGAVGGAPRHALGERGRLPRCSAPGKQCGLRRPAAELRTTRRERDGPHEGRSQRTQRGPARGALPHVQAPVRRARPQAPRGLLHGGPRCRRLRGRACERHNAGARLDAGAEREGLCGAAQQPLPGAARAAAARGFALLQLQSALRLRVHRAPRAREDGPPCARAQREAAEGAEHQPDRGARGGDGRPGRV
mmetsp:Transcript_11230/g.31391  ORF Transcript_11230/g.31391 Transcript_11230/m.31391 type:complete len:243 (+) Transcript_11230:1410-2138(+)